MPGSAVKRRPYDSSNRARQARETRRRIVEAAAVLFVRDGYSATSISAIAEEAGVAVPTVYASLRSKASILRAVVELTVRGDDEAAPLAYRAAWRELEREQDPRERLALFARLHRQICDREAAVFAQLEAAAGADPEATQMLAEHDRAALRDATPAGPQPASTPGAQTRPSGPRGRRRHLDARERAHLSRARTRPRMESPTLRAMGRRAARGRPSTAAIGPRPCIRRVPNLAARGASRRSP